MSKRIILTDFEIEQIICSLIAHKDESGMSYQVIKVGRHFYDQLIAKLKSQHPRSVETLEVSGNDDKTSVAQETKHK